MTFAAETWDCILQGCFRSRSNWPTRSQPTACQFKAVWLECVWLYQLFQKEVIAAKPFISLGCNVLVSTSLSMKGGKPAAQAGATSLAQEYIVVWVELLINDAICGVQNKFCEGWSLFLAISIKLYFFLLSAFRQIFLFLPPAPDVACRSPKPRCKKCHIWHCEDCG